MKILFISHDVNCKGGAGRVLRDLILALPPEVEAECVFGKSHGTFVDALKLAGIPTHIISFCNSSCAKLDNIKSYINSKLNSSSSIEAISKIIKERKIDLVITNTVLIHDGAYAAFKCGVPHVWYIHEILSQDPDLFPLLTFPLSFLYPLIAVLSSKIIVVSRAVSNELKMYLTEKEYEKVCVVHNGIKFLEETPPEHATNGEKIVLSVGTVCRRKGYEQLILSANSILSDFPKTVFVIAGRYDPEYGKMLQARMKVYGIDESRIVFKRFVEDIEQLYKRASVFVLPSECEPFGLVILEAMRAGLPIISTECGGPQDIIVDGVNGLLVKKDKLSSAIKLLLRDKNLADRLGKAGFEYARKNFTHEGYVKKFLEEIL
jgi:glycosyltransferase involved in cell wall biosynthesis